MDLSPPQIFIVLGLIAILLETIVGVNTGFDLLLIGTILIIGGGTGLLTESIYIPLIVSVALTIIYLAFFRSKLRQKLLKVTHHTNVDKLPGQKGVVIRTITPDTAGLVRVDDEDWRASSDKVLYEKTKITVESIEGVTLKVKAVKK